MDDPALLAQLNAEFGARTRGQPQALAAWFEGMQQELRLAARGQRQQFSAGETLSTTALVNEAWLKLRQVPDARFEDRRHFVAIAARAMRQVLIDQVRDRLAQKRGGGFHAVTLDDVDLAVPGIESLVEVGDALDRLEAVRPRLAEVVYLRYFAGLGDGEIAGLLGIDERTVRRDWDKARGFLFDAMKAP